MSQAFAYHSQLKVHKKEYMQQKEWVCPHNNYQWAFTSKGNMEQHRDTHSGQQFNVFTVIINYLWNMIWMTTFDRDMVATGKSTVAKLVTTIINYQTLCNLPHAPHSLTHIEYWLLKVVTLMLNIYYYHLISQNYKK